VIVLPHVALALAVALALDWLVREPPDRFHPVARFGRVVAALDRTWPHPRAVGAVAALALPIGAAAAVALPVAGAFLADPLLGTAVAGLALFTSTSLRALLEEADGVVAAAETDLRAARERLPALVGRDPADLDADHVRSAAVESAAENLADGLVGPLLAFCALAPVSLAAATGGAAWLKAVNTMDSMLGSPDRPVGTAAARLDDVAMWVPARASAVLLTVVARSPDPLLAARRWADAPPSPNGGWPMGTVAGALGVRLEKPGVYELNPVASLPDGPAARRGVRTVGRAGLLAYALAGLWGVVLWT